MIGGVHRPPASAERRTTIRTLAAAAIAPRRVRCDHPHSQGASRRTIITRRLIMPWWTEDQRWSDNDIVCVAPARGSARAATAGAGSGAPAMVERTASPVRTATASASAAPATAAAGGSQNKRQPRRAGRAAACQPGSGPSSSGDSERRRAAAAPHQLGSPCGSGRWCRHSRARRGGVAARPDVRRSGPPPRRARRP